MKQLSFEGEVIEEERTLSTDFILPPFSILDTRRGYWQNRKRAWMSLGIAGESGREDNLLFLGAIGEKYGREAQGTSIFDPFLSEIAYKWFCPDDGKILDPFAGGITRGAVAEILGYKYTGIEIRQEQIETNNKLSENLGISPKYVLGNAADIDTLISDEGFDMIFSSPPYYDLEIYGNDKKDVSSLQSYERFLNTYKTIFASCYKLLNFNRFMVLQVGEIRDKKTGFYRNFVGDNIRIMQEIGFKYYNELILINVVGTLPIRARHSFSTNRKVGKSHQNILVFYKGNSPESISSRFSKTIETFDIESYAQKRESSKTSVKHNVSPNVLSESIL